MIPETKIKAVETGTGLSWESWLSFLEPHQKLDHTAMAELVLRRINSEGSSKSPEWWAQMTTVAYEQHIGRRGIGQRCDGSFSVGASKTMPAEMDVVLQVLLDMTDGLEEFAGVPILSAPTHSATEKWRYWRINLADDSKVTINITNKAANKSSAAVNHDNLADDSNSTELKEWWRGFLSSLLVKVKDTEHNAKFHGY